MVGIGTALVLLGLWALVLRWRRRDYATARWFLRAAAASGIAAVIALEAGWIVTEVGRQPWVVYRFLLTADAVTRAPGVQTTFVTVVVLYTVLGVATVIALQALPASLGRPGCCRRRPSLRRRPGGSGAVRTAPLVGRPRPMTALQATAIVLWLGLTAYAVFGGADFGAGFWDLAAGGTERGLRPRALIADAIGPVWEANHTWLIFDLVILWTAFPAAFAAIMSTLFVPLSLAALGIVLRGAAFAFRPVATGLTGRRLAGAVFAISSVVTPFFLGAAGGAIASGRVPVGNAAGDPWTSWLTPTSFLVGVLAVATCAYLAAVFLVADARRQSGTELVALLPPAGDGRRDRRRRAGDRRDRSSSGSTPRSSPTSSPAAAGHSSSPRG